VELLRYIVLSVILLSVLCGLAASIHQFTRRSGTQKANNSLAFLLLTFSLSVFNVLLLRTRFFGDYEHLYQMPLWFTLSFGPLFFYYVKYKLFPAYRFRPSDLKHLILPFIQVVMLLTISFQSIDSQWFTWKNFIKPFYGPIEYGLFLSTSFMYAIFSYRYVRYRLAQLRKSGTDWEVDTAMSLRHLVRRLTILAAVYTFFALTDFTAFHFLNRDLQDVQGYTFLGDLAMSAVLLWLVISTYWKELTYVRYWGRKNENLEKRHIEEALEQEERFRNSELTPLRLALHLKTSIQHIKRLIKPTDWRVYLRNRRVKAAQVIQQKYPNLEIATIAARLGFYSSSNISNHPHKKQ
jgi:AraC-like DNA-binding protein